MQHKNAAKTIGVIRIFLKDDLTWNYFITNVPLLLTKTKNNWEFLDFGLGISDFGFITMAGCFFHILQVTNRNRNKSEIPIPQSEIH